MGKRSFEILCVDDEPEFFDALVVALSEMPYTVLKASNGPEAFAIIQSRAHQLVGVISDFSMPGFDGLELRRMMMESYSDIPFIMLSGGGTGDLALRTVDLKICAFLTKPIDVERLVPLIGRECGRREAALREDDELRDGFVAEAGTLLEEIEGLFLNLEDATNRAEIIDRIFACVHTIKGASGYFKPDHVHRFAHKFEDYISVYKKNPDTVDSRTIDVFLRGLDIVKSLVTDLGEQRQDAVNMDELLSIFSTPQGRDRAGANRTQEGDAKLGGPSSRSGDQGRGESLATKADSLRVHLSLLDTFMEKSGEITVLRNMINKVLRVIEAENPASGSIATLSDLLGELHKSNGSIQDQMTELRKVQLKQVFKPLARTVRDLGVGLRKSLQLSVEGEELRVDHALADTMSKCLVHLVRNAGDHGIEDAETRINAGKPPGGKISLGAEIVGEDVKVTIADDGRGIDPERIRQKAVERNVISPADAARLSADQLRMLIFHPGFSTAEHVTDVSGRGVGMDMVKQTVDAIDGRIEIHSEIGKGTRFELFLPIPKSVLIVSSLLVRSAERTFALPREAIQRVVKMDDEAYASRVRHIKTSPFLITDHGLFPIVELSSVLNLKPSATPEGKPNVCTVRQAILVVLECKMGFYCLAVDEILDIEDTVVKPAGPWLKAIEIFAGATFLGDGRVGLVLDVDAVGRRIALERSNDAAEREFSLGADTIGIGGSGPSHHGTDGDAGSGEVAAGKVVGGYELERSVLLFNLGTPPTYAILQSELFRLEEINSNKIQRSGGQTVIIYRDEIMPLMWVRDILEGKSGGLGAGSHPGPASGKDSDERLLTLVVRHRDHYLGLVVQSVDDFAALREAEDARFYPSSLEESWVVDDKTITLLRLEKLIA